ncbi:glycosyltransferase family 1 protein [Tulasnella calospora MUT 4182]|uniref:Glycosyltransferase family 1 protein n=1 Tax=Tulasnella calospora MUT 4182 TaxID=1051891 RepID=A0A0C3KMY0_9AGAM|nr:glycosyltransferase family 1 protein [Tulasnella calospora MUT 4182]
MFKGFKRSTTKPPMASNGGTPQKPFHMQDDDHSSLGPSETMSMRSSTPTPSESTLGPSDSASIVRFLRSITHAAYNNYQSIGKGLASSAQLTKDGQILVSLDLKKKLPELPSDHAAPVKEFAVDRATSSQAPPMSIVIMIVGSRGDVQPYIALGNCLKEHGHRVRIATHETFRKMVRDAGLEFQSIGGDPAELMSYMVRNPGLLPGTESLLNGDIPKKRKMLTEVIASNEESGTPFAADAIISNPPAFAHIHCAEALGIPLHLSFKGGLSNYFSYAMADLIQWQGIGDIINNFRTKTLGLDALSIRSGPSLADRLKVPWTYCFSPTLIPKPKDWMNHIDVVGFYFLEGAKNFKPEKDLEDFLAAGPPPIYIGFGSIITLTPVLYPETIFDAIKLANVRAIVSAGWGGLGGKDIPPDVFILTGSVPHDWLFTKVSAVCHHGGAGTTAIGLLLGKPTIIVPFFGDQPFWGEMVHKAGAGPEPIPQKKLKAERLAGAITYCLTDKARNAAKIMADRIRAEDGLKSGVDSFHSHLPLLNMRCDLDPQRVAVWWSQEHYLRLSAFAAQILVDAKVMKYENLLPHRPKEFDTRKKIQDPITGGLGALFWTVTHMHIGVAEIFYKKDGIITATTAFPRAQIDADLSRMVILGMAKLVDSVQEGFYNVPTMYGTNIRKVGRIHDWKTGFVEGGKSFFYGWYDGITGLVTEPIRGHGEEGVIGALKGTGRGSACNRIKPFHITILKD